MVVVVVVVVIDIIYLTWWLSCAQQTSKHSRERKKVYKIVFVTNLRHDFYLHFQTKLTKRINKFDWMDRDFGIRWPITPIQLSYQNFGWSMCFGSQFFLRSKHKFILRKSHIWSKVQKTVVQFRMNNDFHVILTMRFS